MSQTPLSQGPSYSQMAVHNPSFQGSGLVTPVNERMMHGYHRHKDHYYTGQGMPVVKENTQPSMCSQQTMVMRNPQSQENADDLLMICSQGSNKT